MAANGATPAKHSETKALAEKFIRILSRYYLRGRKLLRPLELRVVLETARTFDLRLIEYGKRICCFDETVVICVAEVAAA